MDVSSLVDEAVGIESGSYVRLLEDAVSLLGSEKGRVGNLTVIDHLVKLEPAGDAFVVGDLHGDLESLVLILQESRFIDRMDKNRNVALIFLGDYGDRGEKSAEIYCMILRLKLTFPKQVVLLRGNHEAPRSLMATPHDLPFQFQSRFGEDWQVAYEMTQALWSYLYNAVYVPDRYLMLHGGVSPEISNLRDIAQAAENSNDGLLEDLLWSDPDEGVEGVSFSPRGAGKLFGREVTEYVLGKLNAKVLIRGHEPSINGFKINHGGKVLTLFSRKGSPYFNRSGAFLQLPLECKVEDAGQLIPWVHKF